MKHEFIGQQAFFLTLIYIWSTKFFPLTVVLYYFFAISSLVCKYVEEMIIFTALISSDKGIIYIQS